MHLRQPALRVALRKLLTVSLVGAAVLLSVASTGHTQSQRLPVSGWEAYSMFPQLVVAAQELGFEAYEHDEGVHVDAGEEAWIYFRVWDGKFRRTTEVPEELSGDALDDAERRVASIADDIWYLALEYRAEFNHGPRQSRRSRRFRRGR